MAQIDIIRNGIIDKLLAISDKSFLLKLLTQIESSSSEMKPTKLSSEQKLMLEMSQVDVGAGKTVSLSDLDKADFKWLNEK